jgi:hypothetical protein
MICWSLCAFIWFQNIEKMLLQMTSGFLQLESTLRISILFSVIVVYNLFSLLKYTILL